MKRQEKQSKSDYYPERKSIDGADGVSSAPSGSPVRYIAYPKAMKQLADRLEATPEELAAWVFTEGSNGGLDAFLNANELDPPPRFHYSFGNEDEFDYLSPLMACWFKEDDIARFEPANRHITGKALIERWSQHPGIQPYAFICAKIRESRLQDMHPILGLAQGTNPKDSTSPSLEIALFRIVDVEDIEAEDFGVDKPTESDGKATKAKGHLNHDPQMQQRANEIAAEKMKETRRPVTRNKVAKLLANERGIDEATVLRRIRKQWK